MTKGEDHITNWFVRFVCFSSPLYTFPNEVGVYFLHRDSLLPIFQIFRAYFTSELSFHEFFDLIQHSSEQVVRPRFSLYLYPFLSLYLYLYLHLSTSPSSSAYSPINTFKTLLSLCPR